MRRRFRTEGRTLDSRTIGREMWAVSGGDPRLGVFDGVQMVTPLGTRAVGGAAALFETGSVVRSEEHTSELQSLMRISYAVFCLKKKKRQTSKRTNNLDAKSV